MRDINRLFLFFLFLLLLWFDFFSIDDSLLTGFDLRSVVFGVGERVLLALLYFLLFSLDGIHNGL